MTWLFFCAFIVVLGFILLTAGILAHAIRWRGAARWRTAAGWWTGVLISITLFLVAQPFFQSLPERVVKVSQQSGCDTHYVDVTETDWDTFAGEVVQVDLAFVVVGFFLCLLALEILQWWAPVPEKLLAFIFLALACASLSTLLYVFLIRKLCYLIFSFVLGAVIAVPLHIAFRAKLESWKKYVTH